ncbi:D-2-hydroxyacid dehydrogenase [Alteribacillus bidgolensis]|uniref:Phosphoglycerate dehydrogenase n=1 Tax=Alteribacillus bidgolensis TaxID=930129 RepID=A0A1G8PK77_9BACI|nr:D-2-hydroxyacid dehydrogenase [Alteribacillus bidgolensis]SDI92698.1 Phosphoglycerate dehydrogenase [Alteribacillus bidgolensis]
MYILSSAELPAENQTKLKNAFPEETFVFCNNMDEASEFLLEANIIITYGEDLTENILDQASQLKWVMVIAAGIDKLPFEALNKRNILVTSAKGIHRAPMSEYVFMMLMLVYRQGKKLIENEKNKVWTRDIHMEEITGKSMLIAGTGVIGKEIAKVAKAFQMKTIGVSRSGRDISHFDKNIAREEMIHYLPEVDFVVSVLPSTPETKGFFQYEHFKAMQGHAVFINIGRGDTVRGEEILKAVRDKEIYHAVLDVFETEPLPSDDPFWEEENITVTTHLSGVSPHYHNRALDIFSENLKAFQEDRNELMNIVDTDKGY